MNTRDPSLLSPPASILFDVQNVRDTRHLAIDQVGIRAIRHPILVTGGLTNHQATQATIGTFSMTVGLAADLKGTHMSRFVELLGEHTLPLNTDTLRQLLETMLGKLDATSGRIEVRFPWFMQKAAPVSGVLSLMDYEAGFIGYVPHDNPQQTTIQTWMQVPVTSLCPCSKKISAYGAHNQRSHITVAIESLALIGLDEIATMIEKQASCDLYGVLKRPDEKYVTERAYDNPKFVEDLIRDIALCFDGDTRISSYTIEAENFESIHNHSAYAKISRSKQQ